MSYRSRMLREDAIVTDLEELDSWRRAETERVNVMHNGVIVLAGGYPVQAHEYAIWV